MIRSSADYTDAFCRIDLGREPCLPDHLESKTPKKYVKRSYVLQTSSCPFSNQSFFLFGPRDTGKTAWPRDEDFRGLRRLREDYPAARAYLLYPGTRRWHERGVEVVPLNEALPGLAKLL